MKDYLIGCLYAPTAMSTLALLAYLLMYKKNYNARTLLILYSSIMLISLGAGLILCIVFTTLLEIQTYYLMILGFATIFFICQLLGLTNKNTKKCLKKKDTFRISVDQAVCNNFLKDYQINSQ